MGNSDHGTTYTFTGSKVDCCLNASEGNPTEVTDELREVVGDQRRNRSQHRREGPDDLWERLHHLQDPHHLQESLQYVEAHLGYEPSIRHRTPTNTRVWRCM